MRAHIPHRIESLTAEWLGGQLAEDSQGAGLEDFDYERIGEGEGLIGDVYRLRLAWAQDTAQENADRPASVIAKFPTSVRTTRATAELLGAYEREIHFYAELGRGLPVAIPRCYTGLMDPRPGTIEQDERLRRWLDAMPAWLLRVLVAVGHFFARFGVRRYVLLLEDLAPARAGDQMRGATLAELDAAVATLARLHARFWDSPALHGRRWLLPLDATVRPLQLAFQRALPRFEERFGDRLPEAVRSLLCGLEQRGEGLLRRFAAHTPTLLHGDYRLDNLFFKSAGSGSVDVTVVDWQVPSRGPGVYDLAYFLSSSVEAGDPQEDELLARYHEVLVREGVRDYTFADYMHEYREALLLMLHRITTAAVSIEMTHARSVALTEQWVPRVVDHAVRHALGELL